MSKRASIAAALILAVGAIITAPWFGAIALTPSDVLRADESLQVIFWQLRVPQVLLAFLVGASLGVAGMVYQALFRNPLATPYTLGVASGASLGAVLSTYLGVQGVLAGLPLSRVGGFLGAGIAVIALFACAGRSAHRSLAPLLLMGVALGFLFSSLILLLQFLSSPTQGYIAMRWLMGGLETVGYGVVLELTGCFIVSLFLLHRKVNQLDLLAIDEDLAASRGVKVVSSQLLLIFVSSLLVGVTVAIAGPIGFVGLVVPHTCRLLVGPSHRVLLPVVICVAGAFLVACDCLSRVLLAPAILPVGVVTALIGAPFFLALLMREDRIT